MALILKMKRKIDKETIRNLYASIENKNLSDNEKYRYLTKNDLDIVKYKHEILKIVSKRGLGSYMNTTKWLQLQKEVEKLPFLPNYHAKLITDETFDFKKIIKLQNSSCFGDWSPYYMEGMPLFFSIEYLIVIPTYAKFQGRLVNDKVIDITYKFKTILEKNNIPFEIKNGNFIIYGYK